MKYLVLVCLLALAAAGRVRLLDEIQERAREQDSDLWLEASLIDLAEEATPKTPVVPGIAIVPKGTKLNLKKYRADVAYLGDKKAKKPKVFVAPEYKVEKPGDKKKKEKKTGKKGKPLPVLFKTHFLSPALPTKPKKAVKPTIPMAPVVQTPVGLASKAKGFVQPEYKSFPPRVVFPKDATKQQAWEEDQKRKNTLVPAPRALLEISEEVTEQSDHANDEMNNDNVEYVEPSHNEESEEEEQEEENAEIPAQAVNESELNAEDAVEAEEAF
jgi:hypothetical protein